MSPSRMRVLLGAVAVLAAGTSQACTCNKKPDPGAEAAEAGRVTTPESLAIPDAAPPPASARFSAPIAAMRLAGSPDVVVVGLDVASKAVRLQRVGPGDEVKLDRTVLSDVAWASDADLKLHAGAGGVASLVWRGKRAGTAGRTRIVLGSDLAPRGEPAESSAASCATLDAFVHGGGRKVFVAPFAGAAPVSVDVPKEREVAMTCGTHRAFVVLEHDEGTDLAVLDTGRLDGGVASLVPHPLLRETAGEDEARERAEYVVGDELGVVRLSSGGGLAWRETKDGVPGALRKLRTTIPQDDDVVAVEASARVVVVVYTQEVEGGCPAGASPATKVVALRVDRASASESVVELAAPSCGREIGPFYTSAVGDAVNISWVERVPTAGRARPPIAALAHVTVPAEGAPKPVARLDVEADALADAGCDATGCAAAALVRNPGMDAMVPGPIKILRYAP